MRTSQYFLATLKENPSDAEIISHRLMLRAGMIRKLGSGLYTWLPMGLRVLYKVMRIIREEMNRIGALEILMPAIQPAELWQETDRWDKFGDLLLKIQDRHKNDFCFGPTHEEVVTDLIRGELRSYKQLPVTFYQIQSKFRDEIRPRFGIMRAREFLMKDAYSFNIDQTSLQQSYDDMYGAYTAIFTRLGLKFRAVLADTGSIGGNFSHEFQVLANSGEDLIAYSDSSDYAANIEKAEALAPVSSREKPSAPMRNIDTPGAYTIEAICKTLQLDIKKTIKTLLVEGKEGKLVALLLRGDHELNTIKAEKLSHISVPLTFASPEKIKQTIQCSPGSIGPVNLNLKIVADREVINISDFSCGMNIDDKHYINVNWERDLPLPEIADLRLVTEGDLSPDGKGKLKLLRGIEVGHIFQLGDKYSQAMKVKVLDENGGAITPKMGCYGIGVSRIVAATIEQNHDEQGIIWPENMAPFQVIIIPVNLHKSYRVREASELIYEQLKTENIEVLFEDRKERMGVLLADAELIGIPHFIIVGERGLDQGTVEYKKRGSDKDDQNIALGEVTAFLKQLSLSPQTTHLAAFITN